MKKKGKKFTILVIVSVMLGCLLTTMFTLLNIIGQGVSAESELSLSSEKNSFVSGESFVLTIKDKTELLTIEPRLNTKEHGGVSSETVLEVNSESKLLESTALKKNNPIILSIPSNVKYDEKATKELNFFKKEASIIWKKFSSQIEITWDKESEENIKERTINIAVSPEKSGEFSFKAHREINRTLITSENLKLKSGKLIESEMKIESKKNSLETDFISSEGTVEESISDSFKTSATVAPVSTYQEFHAAMLDASVKEINVIKNIDFKNFNGNTSNPGNTWEINTTVPVRNLIINGNNNIVDFKNIMYRYTTGVSANVTFTDIEMYGKNYWGPFRIESNPKNSIITYNNVYYEGAQLSSSPIADFVFSGEVTNKAVNSYISPFDGITNQAQTNQVTLEATNVTFKSGLIYRGSSENAGVFWSANNGNFTVEENVKMDLFSGGKSGGERGDYAVYLEGSLYIGKNSIVNVSTASDSTRGGIRLNNNNNQLKLENDAKLNVTTNGPVYWTQANIFINAGAKVNIESGSELNLKQVDSKDGQGSVLYGGDNSQFVVAKKGIFTATSDGTNNKEILRFGAGVLFQFANAKKVDIKTTNTNPNTRLINMGNPGKFLVDVQAIKAWSISNVSDTSFTNIWTPMYNMQINYDGKNVNSASANSISTETKNDFIANFRTQNFKRVLFEYIPDVSIKINRPLVNVPGNINNSKVSGVAYPGAYVRLTVVDVGGNKLPDQTLLPSARILSQVEIEQSNPANNYHVKADTSGNWSINLAAGKTLETGMRIKAYAFLNGKDDIDIATVLDQVAPDKPVLNGIKDKDTVITGTAEKGSVVRAYRNKDDTQLGSDTLANATTGIYSVKIPVNLQPLIPCESYYVKASDHAVDESESPAPNTSVRSDLREVVDTTAPTAEPNPKTGNINFYLDPNPSVYVKNMKDNQDTIPGKGFTYEFVQGKGIDQIDKTKIGGQSVVIRVKDAAGNYVDVSTAINIIDDTMIEGTNIYYTAMDFAMIVPDFNELVTPVLLNTEVVKRSKAFAWNKYTGVPVQPEVGDNGGIKGVVGLYDVRIQFLDVDPSTYQNITIKGTVTGGAIEFKKAPSDIQFGVKEISSRKQIYTPVEDVVVAIEDSRGTEANWELFLKVEKDMTLNSNNAVTLPGALSFANDKGQVVEINQMDGLVYTQAGTKQPSTTSLVWDRTKLQGLLLNIKPGQATGGAYTGELVWTLKDTAENTGSGAKIVSGATPE